MAYIDRDKLIREVDSIPDCYIGFSAGYDKSYFICLIEGMPTANVVERKRGKWERHFSRPNVYADLCWHCSVCGGSFDYNWANKWKFCPDCGAEMSREESDNE